jgi:hypothetical protein
MYEEFQINHTDPVSYAEPTPDLASWRTALVMIGAAGAL